MTSIQEDVALSGRGGSAVLVVPTGKKTTQQYSSSYRTDATYLLLSPLKAV